MALKIYQSCNASGKVIGTLAEKGDFNALVAYTGQSGQKLDYMYLLQVQGGDPGTAMIGFVSRSYARVVVIRAQKDATCSAGREWLSCPLTCAECKAAPWLSCPLKHPPPSPSAQSLMMNNPAGAVSLAKMAIKQVPPPFEANTVADLFLQRNMVRPSLGGCAR